MKRLSTVCLVLSGLPLLVYRFVALAGVMSLGGHVSGDEPQLLLLVVKCFLWGSLAYPLVYVPSLFFARMALKEERGATALAVSMIPLCYLLALIALFAVWARM